LASQGDKYPFFALGPSQGHKMANEKIIIIYIYIYIYIYSTLIPNEKVLGLILVIALIGMFDLSFTLALTSNVKWALVYFVTLFKHIQEVVSNVHRSLCPFFEFHANWWEGKKWFNKNPSSTCKKMFVFQVS
jgi:hypothetical protein